MTISTCILQQDINRYLAVQNHLDARRDALDDTVEEIADILLQQQAYRCGNQTYDFDDVMAKAIEQDTFVTVCTLALTCHPSAAEQLSALLRDAAYAIAEEIAETALAARIDAHQDAMEVF
ncbi:hypothetical protein [Grimontia sp. SpTr1]|uniref:hypothetical protein n=1 Tax=Grimontia sp. SpTr1 TaxID=2995319 RepID=UPI00248C3D59|nr:hypothetical protein [Grimontia sp. SpTr1]